MNDNEMLHNNQEKVSCYMQKAVWESFWRKYFSFVPFRVMGEESQIARLRMTNVLA